MLCNRRFGHWIARDLPLSFTRVNRRKLPTSAESVRRSSTVNLLPDVERRRARSAGESTAYSQHSDNLRSARRFLLIVSAEHEFHRAWSLRAILAFLTPCRPRRFETSHVGPTNRIAPQIIEVRKLGS